MLRKIPNKCFKIQFKVLARETSCAIQLQQKCHESYHIVQFKIIKNPTKTLLAFCVPRQGYCVEDSSLSIVA